MSINKLYAIASFANDYHSGQNSRGYKLLCLAQRLLKRKGCSMMITNRQSFEYRRLVANHADKI